MEKENPTTSAPKGALTPDDFRLYLQSEFIRRCDENPNYSLRAFAMHLGVSQSHLFKIFNSQRRLTPKMILRIGDKLNLNPKTMDRFLGASDIPEKEMSSLPEESFKVLSDWYHFALLEIFKTKNFKSDPKWLAARLSISVNECKIAIERLQRVGLLEVNEAGEWSLPSENNSFEGFGFTNAAKRKLQKTLLQKAMQAVDEVDVSERHNASLTVACNQQQLPAVKEKITQFWKSLDEFIQLDPEYEDVYQLAIAFYPLTKKDNNNETK